MTGIDFVISGAVFVGLGALIWLPEILSNGRFRWPFWRLRGCATWAIAAGVITLISGLVQVMGGR